MNTLQAMAHRRQKNAALQLTRKFLNTYPKTEFKRSDLEKAAMRIIQREDMCHEAFN